MDYGLHTAKKNPKKLKGNNTAFCAVKSNIFYYNKNILLENASF